MTTQSNKRKAHSLKRRTHCRREVLLYIPLLKYLKHKDLGLYHEAAVIVRKGGLSVHTKRVLRELVDKRHRNKAKSHRYRAVTDGKYTDWDWTLRSPWPVLSLTLCTDVTGHIFSFLDDESICTAMSVSKLFCQTLAPHRRNVCASGFRSLDSFQQYGFAGMVLFSAKHCNVVNDEFLKCLAKKPYRYLSIANVDLYGCKTVTLKGIVEFVGTMKSRLEHLSLRHFDEPEIKDTESMRALERLLASRTSSLTTLTLELNRAWIKQFRLYRCLHGHPSLRTLSLTLDSRIRLPTNLPHLEVLHLEIVDDYFGAYWIMLLRDTVNYPKLQRLEVTSCSYAAKHLKLSIDLLIAAIATKLPALNYLKIQRTQSHCPMDASYDRKAVITPQVIQRAHFPAPELEAQELQRLKAFAQRRNIRLDCDC
jgi:hypothetical protein